MYCKDKPGTLIDVLAPSPTLVESQVLFSGFVDRYGAVLKKTSECRPRISRRACRAGWHAGWFCVVPVHIADSVTSSGLFVRSQ